MSLDVVPEPVPLGADPQGVIRIGGTRVTLASVVHAFRNGATAEEIAARFPPVALDDIYAVLTYYLRHQAEVDDYLNRSRDAAEEVRRDTEEHHSPAGIRERLVARRPA